MDVTQLKDSAEKLSSQLESLITAFEQLTGTTISSITLNRIDISTVERQRTMLNVDLKVEI